MAAESLVAATARRDLRLRAHAGGGLRRLPRAAAGGPPPLAADVRRRGGARCAVPGAGHRPDADTYRSWTGGAELPRIPGYDVEALLGRGGMGVVYKARHLRLNRLVALKMLLAGAYAGPPERARFQREAEAVASLRHANIVAGLRRGRPRGVPVLHDGAPRRGQPGPGPGGHAAAGPPGGRAPDHAGRGRAGGAPGRDRAPRPEAGQHPAHRRGHAQGRRFRAGAALRRRAGPDTERRSDRDSELHGPRAGDREGGDDRAGRGHLRPRCRAL